ncbi:MAG TPA: peptide chain release factor 1 [Candidatus Syntrophosphaera thermopropionivorans]|jgi:peptide chain release factor 1|nr:peptide chain release factor 1 [Candidatus Syntrophosphaera thermopropionivorans]HOH82188.1 peptide chain release factor 1 [Candidatus Syntrophosphaera thermopropionivorans]HPX62828.1 peptide chain release factor 1 [Candidatus Syntrophosphaera thermopropionivorans]HQC58343.1 peptide chain release factor 1 [Candidatus Syntrophosphaera thermopropionivorans]HQP83831.1 peptide chain release factor 1 [Candidatus Syntrophosphaera thermopropionivorans]
MLPEEKLNSYKKELEELQKTLSDPSIINDTNRYKALRRRYKELEEICSEWDNYQKLEKQLADTNSFLQTESDPELEALAKEELEELKNKFQASEEKIRELLIPQDPNDHKNAIVEIRAGTGGEEAALFAADLFRMYSYYAEKKGWQIQVLSANETELGGYKEIVFLLTGDDVYGHMRFESGVHRVQRIPVTESNGRIHTSAVTVAVLPEAEDIDIDIDEKDLRIDVYRSTGHGGQSVNTTDSAVRITHIPTGIVVTCQDEKSQIKNKAKALKVLRSRLLDAEISRQEQEIARSRKAQVGTGDRSAKIRTYNFPQSRVTDHRINLTSYDLESFMNGEIDDFIQALRLAWRNEKVKE